MVGAISRDPLTIFPAIRYFYTRKIKSPNITFLYFSVIKRSKRKLHLHYPKIRIYLCRYDLVTIPLDCFLDMRNDLRVPAEINNCTYEFTTIR